ncbi:polysaccharide deacetylase family protein [Wenyingzhuangia sp. 2_MG-2023]|uniref:polysaccharide deacetylase family protein n=1 Tax=Wenyingzhuangia sp. 2_MG-2023 TaxID=3062639 RepID=UPI0026E39976|nr:polysaccharide deacetylase family protein [Wenyingzhuangia sp. 2_MG-2023]MDO6736390.1 polysaccharide deacetylase family protein [Wenyingzhuangia sp. 2_MG-2023]
MADELLIYTPKVTPRVSYIFKHIFVRILNIPIKFTSTIEEFVAHDNLKMSYCKAPLGNEFFIQSHGLLLEQGINDTEISISQWESTPCFFSVGKKSKLPFDIFAASFYLLSRYEEYLPSVLDENDCFPAEQSIAFKNNFLDKPLIDVWAYKMLKSLKETFPEYNYKAKKYQYISTFTINQTFLFKSKGIIRSIIGSVFDLFTFKLFNFWMRIATLVGIKEDPHNTFDKIITLQKKYDVKTIFFFLLSNYTTFDNNISFTKRNYTSLIKSIADYARVGLLASYFTLEDEEILKKESKRLERIINTPTTLSKQHYGRNQLPETYHKLIDLNIEEDYTMGYPKHVGFKASTCTPFYFYDLDFEIQTPLKVFPYAFNDNALRFHMQLSPKQALMRINHLANMVKQVNGTLISVFHNDSLSNYGPWKYWDQFYEEVLKCVKAD